MKTVSATIREERLRQGLSISQVEKKTKIKRKFLEAIENGDYKSLPSESYAVGFVKNYAKYLDLDDYKIGKMFRREFEYEQQKIMPSFTGSQMPSFMRIFSTPKFLLVALLLILIGGYLAFQYSSYFFPPKLSVIKPSENQRIDGNVVEIEGKTDPYATVKINDDDAYINLDGSFRKTLYLFSGKREIKIVSENRYGKRSEKIITVEIP